MPIPALARKKNHPNPPFQLPKDISKSQNAIKTSKLNIKTNHGKSKRKQKKERKQKNQNPCPKAFKTDALISLYTKFPTPDTVI